MPGIEAAMERFDAMAGNTPADAGTVGAAKTEAKAETQTATRELTGGTPVPLKADARPAANGKAPSVTETKSDTPAAAAAGNEDGRSKIEDGKAKADAQAGITKPGSGGEAPPEAREARALPDGKSRFAKAQERLEKTWESVNKRKGELDARAAGLEQQRQTLERDKAQLEVIRRQAQQPGHTPEQYVQASQLKRRDADALRMQARRAQEAGRIDEAEKLVKQADKAEGLADDLAQHAERLKKNPPLTLQQREQQVEQARRQWTLEACKAFPEFAKEGSRIQQVVAQHLNALAKSDPQLLVHPSLIYHLGRLADAQIKLADSQAVAARVPELEKETGKLRSRIKELEAETSPAANGAVARLGVKPADDYGSLRRDAADLRGDGWLQ